MEQENRPERECIEFDFKLPEEEKVIGYRRPEKNQKKKGRRKTMGLSALCLCLVGFVLLLAFGLYAIINLTEGSLSSSILSAATVVVFVSAAFAIVSFLLSIIVLILRKQKKGAAIASIILSLLLLLMCSSAVYAYDYLFGSLNEDRGFQDLSNQDLNVVEKDPEGEIVRETTPPASTVPHKEIEEKSQHEEIEWEYLEDDELPDKVKEIIYGAKPTKPSYLLDGADQISTFVLYGTDRVGSSDSIILLSVDRVHHKVKMISIARDSYVTIPQWGSHAKITYAYAWGGAQMAVSTLNYNYFLNVTDYITVNMEQLADIVDLVGGVEVDLDWSEVSYLSGTQRSLNYGKCRLYGKAAVLYSRIRSDNEINRTGRQREVLTSLMTSISEMSVTDYPQFVRACLGMCTTSFNSKELMDIVLEVVQNGYTIESYAILEEVDYWGGRLGRENYFYCVYDLNRASDVIYRIIYEDLYLSGYPDEEEPVTEETVTQTELP